MIVCDILAIIVIDKRIVPHRPVNGKGGNDEEQTDQKIRTYTDKRFSMGILKGHDQAK